MNIKATDEWMEDLALQCHALRAAVHLLVTANPQAQVEVQALATNLDWLYLPTKFSEKQVERIATVLRQLSAPLTSPPSGTDTNPPAQGD